MYVNDLSVRWRNKNSISFLFSFTLFFFIYLQSAYAVYLLCPRIIFSAFQPAVIVNPFYGVLLDEPFVLLEVILCLLPVHELYTIEIGVLFPRRYLCDLAVPIEDNKANLAKLNKQFGDDL